MNYQERVARLLFGSNRQGVLVATAIGILLGVGAWLIYPMLGVEYWLWPSSLIDWGFVVGFVLLATGVAFYRSGLLATWWMSFPAHVVLAHYFYYSQSGFVVLPFQNDLLSFALISATIALFYGLVGYLLGTVSRWGKGHTTFSSPETVER